MAAMGQTAPSSFVTAAAGLAPIADVPGGYSDPPITRPASIRLRKRRRAARWVALRQPRHVPYSAVDALAAGPGGGPPLGAQSRMQEALRHISGRRETGP